ncbi:hypothetical protein K402DRAFT_424303 [Aulographum hederae CBS 113979]|uniref:Uncharacterized protein n=1 Tax=Aulographum hederae CBS 113979 TaxID=1176131 RepID=A0A6G1GP79_9PEZI|nr:hypothetical protein K402DRAFT_424303 [Aulographum hederae CBS 113979]
MAHKPGSDADGIGRSDGNAIVSDSNNNLRPRPSKSGTTNSLAAQLGNLNIADEVREVYPPNPLSYGGGYVKTDTLHLAATTSATTAEAGTEEEGREGRQTPQHVYIVNSWHINVPITTSSSTSPFPFPLTPNAHPPQPVPELEKVFWDLPSAEDLARRLFEEKFVCEGNRERIYPWCIEERDNGNEEDEEDGGVYGSRRAFGLSSWDGLCGMEMGVEVMVERVWGVRPGVEEVGEGGEEEFEDENGDEDEGVDVEYSEDFREDRNEDEEIDAEDEVEDEMDTG